MEDKKAECSLGGSDNETVELERLRAVSKTNS